MSCWLVRVDLLFFCFASPCAYFICTAFSTLQEKRWFDPSAPSFFLGCPTNHLLHSHRPTNPPIQSSLWSPISILLTARTIPAIVAMWYARSKKYGEKNVMYDSYAWYNHMLSDASQMKNMPEVRLLVVCGPERDLGRGDRFRGDK